MTVFDLNQKQKAAFNRLKKAYKDCEKVGIYFVNNYGNLEAYNSEYVKEYTDRAMIDKHERAGAVSTMDYSAINYFKIPTSWADDEHLIVLTENGKKLFNDELKFE